jgi:hypothetical protein
MVIPVVYLVKHEDFYYFGQLTSPLQLIILMRFNG